MNELEQARLEAWRLDEQRRIDQRREDDLRLADMRAADERARIELRHSDHMRLADMRASADPATREVGEKVQMVMDSRARQEQREADLTGRERLPDRAHDPDLHADPGWLARWEREGTMTTLTPAEREKLREIDREDPMGRSMRELFLPREVLAIRANSDRWVEQQRQEREASTQAMDNPDHVEERAPEPNASASARKDAPEQDEDEELEI